MGNHPDHDNDNHYPTHVFFTKNNFESISGGSVAGTTSRLCILLPGIRCRVDIDIDTEPTLLETTPNSHQNNIHNNNNKAQCLHQWDDSDDGRPRHFGIVEQQQGYSFSTRWDGMEQPGCNANPSSSVSSS